MGLAFQLSGRMPTVNGLIKGRSSGIEAINRWAHGFFDWLERWGELAFF